MDKFDFSTATIPEEKETKRTKQGHGRCEVYGCPRWGHFFNGTWNCRYHDGKGGKNLARITLILKNHEREINWYEHILNCNQVDFAMGDVAKNAPYGLEVNENETWREYKKRLVQYITDLLAGESHE